MVRKLEGEVLLGITAVEEWQSDLAADPACLQIELHRRERMVAGKQLEDEVVAKLERVAPGRSRRRSEFIRMAVRRALWDLEEQATAEAYRRHPDSAADAYVEPSVWEPRPRPTRRQSKCSD